MIIDKLESTAVCFCDLCERQEPAQFAIRPSCKSGLVSMYASRECLSTLGSCVVTALLVDSSVTPTKATPGAAHVAELAMNALKADSPTEIQIIPNSDGSTTVNRTLHHKGCSCTAQLACKCEPIHTSDRIFRRRMRPAFIAEAIVESNGIPREICAEREHREEAEADAAMLREKWRSNTTVRIREHEVPE